MIFNMSKPHQTYKCSHCTKIYTRKIYYDRHIICCSLKAMADVGDRSALDQQNDTPSTKELYMIIQELVKKQNKMEEELKSLRRYTDRVKRNINVIEWLNSNSSPIEYSSWRDLIKIKRNELEYIFSNGLFHGIINIFKNNLSNDQENPIKSFEHKKNTLFVYKNGLWDSMDSDDFKKLIRMVNQKIIQEFNAWTLEKTEDDQLKKYPYDEYVIRIFSNTLKDSEIKTKIYDYLKISIKNINKIEI